MAKLFVFNMISLDGFFAGPNGDLSWHRIDQEFNDFVQQQLNKIGGLLFGHKTYDMMATWWPSEQALQSDPEVANKMNALPKVVFSTSLTQAKWQNSTIMKSLNGARIAALKRSQAKDIAIFGSSQLCVSLLSAGLIDEIRLMVNPVILGSGQSLFAGLRPEIKLQLKDSRIFNSGNILLTYNISTDGSS